MSVPRALVVGAGIGGLCAAVALQRSGLQVSVVERSPRPRTVGGGLTLASNALSALAWLGLDETVRRRGAPFTLGALRRSDGRFLLRAAAATSDASGVALHRADLQAVLLDALGPERVRFAAAVERVTPGEHTASVAYADGRVERYDLVVGADGFSSTLRRQLHGDGDARYAGATAWRGVAALDVDAASTETWGRGRRFGIVPLGAGRTYWFAVERSEAGGCDPETGVIPTLRERFAGWHQPIDAVLAATQDSAVVRHDLHDRPPLAPPWGIGRVTLLGDAAHPTTPNLGQGACQAIESAVVLGRCVAERDVSAARPLTLDPLSAALRRYEQQRAPRTAAITRASWRFGQIAQLDGRVAVALRDAFMALTPAWVQARQVRSVVDVDVTR